MDLPNVYTLALRHCTPFNSTLHVLYIKQIPSCCVTIYQETRLCVSGQENENKARHTSVLFTGTIKSPNSAFYISKTTKPISIQFIYFLPYIYTTSHIKIEGNCFCISWDICSWKLPNFLLIFFFLHKITNKSCYLIMFWIWNINDVHLGLHFLKIKEF